MNVVVAAMLVIWPLSCLRGLTPLRHVSICSIVTIVFTSLVVIAEAPGHFAQTGRDLRPVVLEVRMSKDGLQVLAIICFAFMVHTNTPEVALHMRVPAESRANQVVGAHTLLLCVV